MPNIHYQWFMTSMLATAEGKSRGNPYIGILSNQSDGRDHQFHWVDNTPLEFTNWAKNEPDGKSEDGSIYQTVVEVFSHTHDTGIAGQWIDQTKSYERAYMCSHQTVTTEIDTGYDDCPNGWIQLRHFCYKMFTNPLRNRFQRVNQKWDLSYNLYDVTVLATNKVSREHNMHVKASRMRMVSKAKVNLDLLLTNMNLIY